MSRNSTGTFTPSIFSISSDSIFAIVAQAEEGLLKPGDDLLFLVVAGDIREHVKATFAELLDRIKAEAVIKQEYHEA